jgi:hypothetical protein
MKPILNKDGDIHFSDYPDFKPNLSPEQIFRMGSFGGTYWRPIYSSVTEKKYKNEHLKFPKSWWKDINENLLTTEYSIYDKTVNKYNVKVGLTLEDWESYEWIKKYDPYGWVQWYCNFYNGRRGKNVKEIDYDKYQISRWEKLAGKRGRFRNSLITYILNKNTKYDDYTVSPKIRQTLQHWGYILTKKDFIYEKNRRKRKTKRKK